MRMESAVRRLFAKNGQQQYEPHRATGVHRERKHKTRIEEANERNQYQLFSKTKGSEVASSSDGFSEKWGWYQSIYGLAQGNVRKFNEVTKLNLHTCLQYLAFEKDKADLQEHIFKKK